MGGLESVQQNRSGGAEPISWEGINFLNILGKGETSDSDLWPAFVIDARNALRHPVFWRPKQCIGFIQKLGELLLKLMNNNDPGTQFFKDIINRSNVKSWKDKLLVFEDLKRSNELKDSVGGVYENDSTDFCMGIRHL
ncbi:hypothetical protein MKW92_014674, partial [Papaver armeniacum]